MHTAPHRDHRLLAMVVTDKNCAPFLRRLGTSAGVRPHPAPLGPCLLLIWSLLCFGFLTSVASGQTITTVAGGGPPNNISALSAPLNLPVSVAFDSTSGSFYIATYDAWRVYKVDSTGKLTTFAGGGASGDGIPATQGELLPTGVAVDSSGDVFISDGATHTVREVTPDGTIHTVAGSSTLAHYPVGVAVDSHGNVFVADSGDHRIYQFTVGGSVQTVAGTGTPGYNGDGILATNAELNNPQGVAVDGTGNLFIADSSNQCIRRVDAATAKITTVAGTCNAVTGAGTQGFNGDNILATNAELNNPQGVAVDEAGNVFIADSWNYAIREVTAKDGLIHTVAGTPQSPGYAGDGGPAASSQVNDPQGVAFDQAGDLLIADTNNNLIREVTPNASYDPTSQVFTGTIQSVAGDRAASYYGDGGPALGAVLGYPGNGNLCGQFGWYGPEYCPQVVTDAAGDMFLADSSNNVVREINALTGIIATIAGNYALGPGWSGDGGLATQAQLNGPAAMAFAGNLFIADTANNDIRELTTDGKIHTIAGTNSAGFSGDGGPATQAQLNAPLGLTFDGFGNLFIVDSGNCLIRKVDFGNIVAGSPVITTVAGDATNVGVGAYGGDGGAATSARLNFPKSAAFDVSRNWLYIADGYNAVIRKVDFTAGQPIITTVAGQPGQYGYSGDGGSATSAQMGWPSSVIVDGAGNLFIADESMNTIREVTAADGKIWTVAGIPGWAAFAGDGGPATSAELFTPTGIAGDAGNLLIFDTGNGRIREVTGLFTPLSQAPPAAPAVNFSPNPLSFASPVATQTSQMLTISNSGAGLLTINTLTLSGTNAADFNFGSGGTCGSVPIQLGSGQSCTMYLLFTPSINGNESAQILVGDNAGGSPQSVGLQGTEPVSTYWQFMIEVVFGSGQNYALAGVESQVTVTAQDSSGHTLASFGGTVQFASSDPAAILPADYTFTAADAGTHTFPVTLNTPGLQGISVWAVSGGLISSWNGIVEPGASSLGSVSFGNVATTTLTYTFPNSVTLGPVPVSVLTQGVPNLDFQAVSSGTTCGATTSYQAGQGCTVAVQFRPTAPGLRMGAVEIADSGGNLLFQTYVSGIGQGPVAAFSPGTITTVAGNGGSGYSGDGGSATSAQLDLPVGVAVDAAKNIYFADSDNNAIRKVTPAGNISTVAGGNGWGYSGDGGSATSAQLFSLMAWRWMAPETSTSPTTSTAAFARWRRMEPSPRWRAMGPGAIVETMGRRLAPSSIGPRAWRWMAPGTSTSRTATTSAK